MKNISFMLFLFFCSFSSNGFDKFDAAVCEASTDDLTRTQCYRKAKFSSECKNKEVSKELTCYRDIVHELEKKEQEEVIAKQLEIKNSQTSPTNAVSFTETPIPRSVAGDKGQYFLLDSKKTENNIIKALHKRVGVYSVGFTMTEINCATMKMREIGYSEESPSKIIENPTDWFNLVSGSSKSDLAEFVCK